MFNSIFDELIGLKYFTRNNKFQEPFNVKYFKEIKRLKGLQVKAVSYFRTQVSIYDGAFLWIYLTAYYFPNKCFIIDVQLGYIKAAENIEISKVKFGASHRNC